MEGKDCHCTHLAYAGKRKIIIIVTAVHTSGTAMLLYDRRQ